MSSWVNTQILQPNRRFQYKPPNEPVLAPKQKISLLNKIQPKVIKRTPVSRKTCLEQVSFKFI
jgi:hypothetical protein